MWTVTNHFGEAGPRRKHCMPEKFLETKMVDVMSYAWSINHFVEAGPSRKHFLGNFSE